MKFNIENIFSTPIYVSLITNIDQVHEEYNNIKSKLTFHEALPKWGKTHTLTTTSFNDNIIDELHMYVIKETIDTNLMLYCQNIGFKYTDYTLTSWITSFEEGSYSHTHNHGWSDISGCYYYETNEQDGDIFFETPCPSMATSYCYNQLAQRWKHIPKVGKLLLFPSWLLHGVTTNTTDSVRKSLAFNIHFNRK